jgi:hypothetical protein
VQRSHTLARGLAALLLLAGCGGGGGGDGGDGEGLGGPIPECAKTFPEVDPPRRLPKEFPLPPGFVFTLARYDDPGRFSLSGVVRGSLDSVAGFFEEELPERGYTIGRGDAEPGEKEAPFTGNGYRGAWRVNMIQDCPAVTVGIILVQQL